MCIASEDKIWKKVHLTGRVKQVLDSFFTFSGTTTDRCSPLGLKPSGISGKSNLVKRFLRKTAPRLLCLPPFPFCTFAGIFALSGKYLCTWENNTRSAEFSSMTSFSPRRGLVPCARHSCPVSAPCDTVDTFLSSQTQPSARPCSASQNNVGKAQT